ncbi:MAG: hypothetical protein RIR50_567, partial [Pseudomonadota bacterium]
VVTYAQASCDMKTQALTSKNRPTSQIKFCNLLVYMAFYAG